ncbi:hypothetical protein E9549_05150 [Blastococcus sp. MG754426]|uniref:hypothetical protein n=1 Tax=unclassified Blastococcus TaxID=2619396 RepID=UPI001EF0F64D|nr:MULTISPECIES: hypothetical protein [unclassified Blastococcus]MCF6506794.1 hypothetical protein [Blastococcus sp. MG754426]MCF6511365.1 hypothetical protein [Blastococcus sp. MG754427]MCF6734820.1 hypothetical protein [Blastococcus sp. KM273129]
MTSAEEPLAIRLPPWVRTLGPVLLALWLAEVVLRHQAWGRSLVPVVVLTGLVAVVVGRMLSWSVVGSADGRLTVRNTWSTRTFLRGEITAVGIDRAGRPARGWAVFLLLDDGTRHRLDVTEAPFFGPSHDTLERQAAAVRAWLDGRAHAHL